MTQQKLSYKATQHFLRAILTTLTLTIILILTLTVLVTLILAITLGF